MKKVYITCKDVDNYVAQLEQMVDKLKMQRTKNINKAEILLYGELHGVTEEMERAKEYAKRCKLAVIRYGVRA